MDSIDKQIIQLLGDNARASLKEIAAETFLSSPAVSARIARLENEGIITGYSAQINLHKLGYHITAFINLELSPKQKPTFYPFVKVFASLL